MDTAPSLLSMPPASPAPVRKRRKWPYVLGGIVVLIGLVVALFDWNWFKPLVERQASAALGRPVTIGNFHVVLGRIPHVTAEGVRIANPTDWPGGGDFATIDRLAVDIDAMAYLRQREIVIPLISVDRPQVEAVQLPDGKTANWALNTGSSQPASGADRSASPKIGNLRIQDGTVHVVIPKLRADFGLGVATRETEGSEAQIVVDAKGTYAAQPIAGRFVGGALLSLRDAAKPYPIDLQAANGPTKVSLKGTVQNPLNFAGADLKLDLSGPDMALLMPLTGIPIPQTPPYQVSGNLDYADRKIRFKDFAGRVGSSDIGGTIAVDPTGDKPVVNADLRSRLVDLDDLGGFIGATPGRTTTPGQTAAQRQNVARAEASAKLLPDTPINLPKLNAADIHLAYKGDKLRGGRSQPLDNISVRMDIVDGAVNLHPLAFGIGAGQITSQIALAPQQEGLHAKADIQFQRLDVGKLLNSTGVAQGGGTLSGRAVLDAQGRSMAQMLGAGNGELKLYMQGGGNISALIADLAGLQFGQATLSALGVPTRARIECLATDFVLQRGLANARQFLLDTDESRITATGNVNLQNETLGLKLEAQAKHFSVGNFPTPINITGTFKNPGISPEIGPLALRGGAAIGLGIVATPLAALLPTIEFGTGEDGACGGALRQVQTPPRVVAAPARRPAARRSAPARRR